MIDLYSKHEEKIKRSARSHFPNPTDLEDAMQEARIKLHSLQVVDKDNEEAYVVRTCTNLFRDMYRKGRRQLELDTVASIGDGVHNNDPLSSLLEERTEEELSMRIDDLPDELRVTARLYYLDGLSYADIGEALNIPTGTVGSRLNKARKLFAGD